MSDSSQVTENRLIAEQEKRNAASRDNWDNAAPHRERVTQFLLDACIDAEPSLGILGAGNANDLDLRRLVEAFESIELFDVDESAMQSGLAAQELTDAPNLATTCCDVTGIWDKLTETHAGDDEAIAKLIESAKNVAPPTERRFGTIASTCLLSQLIDGVLRTLPESHPKTLELIQAVRLGHLRLLVDLLVPGGQGILVTDFIATTSAPFLLELSEEELPAATMKLIEQGNFFTGANPFRATKLFYEEPDLREATEGAKCHPPWLWNFGPRHYAVTAITFRKKA